MRVVEPQKSSVERQRNMHVVYRILVLLLVVVVSVCIVFAVNALRSEDATAPEDMVSTSEPPLENIEKPTNKSNDVSGSTLRTFSANEFRLLYENILQPGLEGVAVPPYITQNDIADGRIRQLAEARGYKLRSVASGQLVTLQGVKVQPALQEPWIELQQEARADGVDLSIVSGFRSIEEQRALFVDRLLAQGIQINDIASGAADNNIITVLVTTAVPGYSKHHTGYTIDLLCAGYAFENFNNSSCHDWLSADNFERAKRHGFIPSYPIDADLQGPDPEAWEYVYIGQEVLKN